MALMVDGLSSRQFLAGGLTSSVVAQNARPELVVRLEFDTEGYADTD